MATVTNIFVDIDACAAHHPALEQTVSAATRCGARVKFAVVPSVPGVRHSVTPERERDLVEHAENDSAIAGGLRGVGATTDILRPETALTEEILRSQHDRLVRSHSGDESAGAKEFGAMDIGLLRQCQCPVWLVARHALHQPSRILASASNKGRRRSRASAE